MKRYIERRWNVAGIIGLGLILSAFSPERLLAQAADSVYNASELSTAPHLSSTAAAARLIRSSYPDQLKRAGIGGDVQVEFVIDPQGKVDPSSIQVVMASVPALGEAAKSVVRSLEFSPGKVNGTPVRTRVVLPLVYKIN